MAFGFLSHLLQGDKKPGGGVFGFLRSVGEQTANPVYKLANEVRALPSVATGNIEAARKTLQSGGGFGHQGGVLGGAELNQGPVFGNTQNIKKAVGTGVSIGANIAAPGAATGKTIATRAVSGAVKGAPLGFLGAAAPQVESGNFDPKALVAGTVGGAALGSALPIAQGTGKIIANIDRSISAKFPATQNLSVGKLGLSTEAAKPGDVNIQTSVGDIRIAANEMKALQNAKSSAEVKSVIGKALPENTVNRIAPAIAQTKDTNVIKNIFTNELTPSVPRPSLVGQDITPAPVSTAPVTVGQGTLTGEVIQPEIKTITDALKQATPLRQQQEKLYSAERSQRAGAAGQAGANIPGTAGYQAELSQLQGPLQKVKYTGLSGKLEPQAQENLFTKLRSGIQQDPNVDYYTALNTQKALRKVIFGEGLPTKSELGLLKNRYGKDFVDTVENDVTTHQQALTKLQQAGQLLGLPRELVASGDVSGLGRQALAAFTAHPITVGKNFVNQFKFYKTKNFEASQAELASRPNFGRALQGKLAILDPSSKLPNETEEKFLSNLGEKIPVIGKFIKASNQSFTGTLNRVRMDIYDQLLENADNAGYNINDSKIITDLAKVVNNGTGRGEYGKFLEKHAGALSTVFFSPRLMASRIRTFDPVYYTNLSAPARKEALRQLAGLGAFATTVLTLAKMAGANVNTDPTNADFGKAKFGDTRIDFLGGFQQYIRLGAQLAEGKITSSVTGATQNIGAGFGAKSAYDVLTNFFENKENPTASFVTTMLKGTDISGENVRTPKGVASQLIQRAIPLAYQDIKDLFSHPESFSGNKVAKAVAGAGTIAGIGTQTYGKQDIALSDTQKAYLDKISDPMQSSATKDFFQTLKIASGKHDNTSESINRAIATGNLDIAQQLADEYNQQLIQAMKPWAQNSSQYLTEDLAKELKSDLINLDNSTIKSRLKTIAKNPKKYGVGK